MKIARRNLQIQKRNLRRDPTRGYYQRMMERKAERTGKKVYQLMLAKLGL